MNVHFDTVLVRGPPIVRPSRPPRRIGFIHTSSNGEFAVLVGDLGQAVNRN